MDESAADKLRSGINYIMPLHQLKNLVAGRVKPEEFPVLVDGFDRVFLSEARLAAARSHQASADGDSLKEAGGAGTAIVMSAIACEAWLSEFLAFVEMMSDEDRDELLVVRPWRDAQKQFREVLRLRAPTVDVGSLEDYRQLGCLFRLRDHVAHRSARFLTVQTWPPRLADCVRTQHIPVRIVPMTDWTSVTLVHEVASWAVGVAERWLKFINRAVGELPHRDFQNEEVVSFDSVIPRKP